MLEELIDAATWGALPFFMVGLFIWSHKWRLIWVYACCASLAYLLVSKALFQWHELPSLVLWVDLTTPIFKLLTWSLFGACMAAIGGWRPWGPPWLASFLTGFMLGPIAAAIALSKMSANQAAASRLVLSAAGGSLFGIAGNPALLLLSQHQMALAYLYFPLAVIFVLIASPRTTDFNSIDNPDRRLFVFGLAVAVSVCLFSAYASLFFLAAALLLMAAGHKRMDWAVLFSTVAWTAGICILVIGATATGFPELAAWELEEIQTLRTDSVLNTLGLGGLFISCFADAQGSALLGQAFADRAMDLHTPGAIEVLSCGLAAGGVLHLFVAKVWQESLNKWFLQMLACMAYMVFLSEFLYS